MVFINDKKFACESCIKGHRSSSCAHTERPLFEIKKKGRPVSQCERCRQLRQSKRVHSKCTCNSQDADEHMSSQSSSSPGSKARRFVQIVPALPNGLKDVASTSNSNSLPPDSRQRVDSLLNPCTCKSVWDCKCQSRTNMTAADGSSVDSPREAGLAALARAAALCYDGGQPSPYLTSTRETDYGAPPQAAFIPQSKRERSRPSSPNHKRPKSTPPPLPTHPRVLQLPPILSTRPTDHPPPTFPTIPGISTLASIAGTGCTCGLQCACPGCVEHRGAEHASIAHSDCTQGCGHCVDRRSGVALPGPTGATVIDRFFARAAALPPPPDGRTGGAQHYPRNVLVYAADVRSYGRVQLPKLECCDGRCGCPVGSCACAKACAGGCAEHGPGRSEYSPVQAFRNGITSSSSTFMPRSPTREERMGSVSLQNSCCSA